MCHFYFSIILPCVGGVSEGFQRDAGVITRELILSADVVVNQDVCQFVAIIFTQIVDEVWQHHHLEAVVNALRVQIFRESGANHKAGIEFLCHRISSFCFGLALSQGGVEMETCTVIKKSPPL